MFQTSSFTTLLQNLSVTTKTFTQIRQQYSWPERPTRNIQGHFGDNVPGQSLDRYYINSGKNPHIVMKPACIVWKRTNHSKNRVEL